MRHHCVVAQTHFEVNYLLKIFLYNSISETKLWSAARPKSDPTSRYLTWLLQVLDLLTEAAGVKEKKLKHAVEFKEIMSKVIQVRINCVPPKIGSILQKFSFRTVIFPDFQIFNNCTLCLGNLVWFH